MKTHLFTTLIAFLLLCGLWEMTSLQLIEYRFILPSPSSIIFRLWSNPWLFIDNSKTTLREMAGGFGLALSISFPLAWSMCLWKSCRSVVHPLFVLLQSVPMFTLAPIMVLWFGWSYIAIVIPTALMIFLPLTMNIYQGLSSTPQALLDLFTVNQATSWQKFWKLQLPYAIPYIFAGFKVAAATAGIGAIAGEWAGGQSGLGVLMLSSRRETDLQTTFAALLCLALMSLCFYGVVTWAEERFAKHKPMKLFTSSVIIVLAGIVSFLAIPASSDIKGTKLLLDWFPNSNHVPIYVGLQKGFFEKRGIHLEVLQLHDPSDTIPYVTSGKADLALFYMPDVVRANKNGANLTVAARLINQPLNSFIYLQDAGIKTSQDLSDKVIGYCVAGNTDVLKKLCRISGVVPKEFRNVSFDLVSALGMAQVDVIYGAFWNVEIEHLRSLGIHTAHFNVTELGHPDYSELVFIASDAAEKYSSFRAAMQESIDYSKANPEEAFNLYKQCHPGKSDETLAWEKSAWMKTIPTLAISQDISQEEIEGLSEWY
jgi:ABC-type nitrate/sulfonate/bicarbonate transport system permease component/ABC-type nitrate/sulfonate/bicarbonate transport system substrate-binding protein